MKTYEVSVRIEMDREYQVIAEDEDDAAFNAEYQAFTTFDYGNGLHLNIYTRSVVPVDDED